MSLFITPNERLPEYNNKKYIKQTYNANIGSFTTDFIFDENLANFPKQTNKKRESIIIERNRKKNR